MYYLYFRSTWYFVFLVIITSFFRIRRIVLNFIFITLTLYLRLRTTTPKRGQRSGGKEREGERTRRGRGGKREERDQGSYGKSPFCLEKSLCNSRRFRGGWRGRSESWDDPPPTSKKRHRMEFSRFSWTLPRIETYDGTKGNLIRPLLLERITFIRRGTTRKLIYLIGNFCAKNRDVVVRWVVRQGSLPRHSVDTVSLHGPLTSNLTPRNRIALDLRTNNPGQEHEIQVPLNRE